MTYDNDKGAKPAAHDLTPPKALIEFMMTQWKPREAKAPAKVKRAEAHAARRKALSALFPGEVLVIPTGHEKIRANDTVYRFRAGSDFFYLTGNLEPDCVLVMDPNARGGHDAHLFVEPNPGRSNHTFFTNRMKGELWVGPRLGVAESQQRYGTEHTHGLPDLHGFLATRQNARVLRGLSDSTDALVEPHAEQDQDLTRALSELRLCKDPLEVQELKAVIASTRRGFEDVIRSLKTGKSEREVEGAFALRARVEGNDVGYGTIAAAGAHACILHWTHNDGALKKNELLLLDAGVEGHALYTADITRVLPIGGKFSNEQREIYTLVWQAQQAAFTGVAPGNDFMEPNRRAMRVLAEGLQRLGILESAEDALKHEHQFYKRYSLHNVSHMLGLDVHDCAKARNEVYRLGPLKPGMVLTVEPGLYFQKDDLTVPARYRGIGVRIEDDVLVTEKGMTNLSASIPSAPDAVEAWMKSVWGARGKRR
jgi:Xaa-Pro aminopeptidase